MKLSERDLPRAARIGEALAHLGYNEQILLSMLGFDSPVRLAAAEQAAHADKLAGTGSLGLVIRLFFLEQAVPRAEFQRLIEQKLANDLCALGLVEQDDKRVKARVLLVPAEDRLVAGDRYQKLPADTSVEHVLSVNPPARFLLRMALRQPARRLLDLCTGNGIFALVLASIADKVVATDLNPRALEFARLNAALNGIGNIELRLGALFAPVAGERFDRIICNPPYILTPSKRFLCTDSEQELDGFCLGLVREAPQFLTEGGVLQMICEWVEYEGEDWRNRLSQWFDDNGCDAWVVCSGRSDIEAYCRLRHEQTLVPDGTTAYDGELSEWLDYFRDRNVHGIRSGFIQLRRRHGKNWRSFTSLGGRVASAVADDISSGFAIRDRYHSASDEEILALRPVPVEGLSLLPAQADRGPARLVKTRGLPVSFSVNAGVAALIDRVDGNQAVAQISDEIAAGAGVDIRAARAECCAVVRELLCQGLLASR